MVLAAVLMPAFAREDRRSTLFKIFILSIWFSSDWEGMTSWINGIIPEGAATFEMFGWDTASLVDMAATWFPWLFVIFFLEGVTILLEIIHVLLVVATNVRSREHSVASKVEPRRVRY